MANPRAIQNQEFSRLKLFWALSRTPHGLLDIATPGLTALLWLGALPSLRVLSLGLVTAFAAYTAVYALNDLIDYRVDREKMGAKESRKIEGDLDTVYVRHPLAQGILSYPEGFLWMAGWASLALFGSFLLNPLCAFIFLIACLLEVIYCCLLKVTWLRGIISGVVKNSGGIAAVFAVDPNPSPLFLSIVFLWLFSWELGGQNIPNDWIDLEEDKSLHAQTIPIRFGPEGSLLILYSSLILTLIMSLGFLWVSPIGFNFLFFAGAVFSGLFFLLLPLHRLWKNRTSREASALFNRASYYPFAMLVVTLVSITI